MIAINQSFGELIFLFLTDRFWPVGTTGGFRLEYAMTKNKVFDTYVSGRCISWCILCWHHNLQFFLWLSVA
jgi:hypothetical protein